VTQAEQLAAFIVRASYDNLSEAARHQLKIRVLDALGCAIGTLEVMFEAANPEVFAWYVKNYGPEVNLFVDHSQIVQLECLRSGIWGTKSLWGRVLTYKG